jgi:tRNA(Ile2) C34 agmatinyltransferase TiaS
MTMAARDQHFLLYPLDTGEDPVCLGCGTQMTVAGHEARETKPDFITFRCPKCGRSERFLCEE